MADPHFSNATSELPTFLRLCVDRGILQLAQAKEVATVYHEAGPLHFEQPKELEQASVAQVVSYIHSLTRQTSQLLAQASLRLDILKDNQSIGAPSSTIAAKLSPSNRSPEALDRLKQMMSEAETPEEQALALQIALGERLMQLRDSSANQSAIARIERALELVRCGEMGEAIGLLNV